jgi:DNA polymerase I-like protein with 3'-5' exonuclease and polymerase domains
MNLRNLAVLDFETEPIRPRPHFPPKPVGVALTLPGRRPKYWAWGHPDGAGNNCTLEEGRARVADTLREHESLVWNGQFDFSVVVEALGLPLPDWRRIHDAQTLAFLHDPHGGSLKLKVLAEQYLGDPPEEQNRLRDWIMANCRDAAGKPPKPSEWGEYICRAPVSLAGPYACGDVVRTLGLFKYLWPLVMDAGMGRAYDLERRLLPCLMEMERDGVPLDADRLAVDLKTWERNLERADDWLRKRLDAPGLDVSSGKQFAAALDRAGAVSRWIWTAPSKTYPGGQRSTALDALLKVVNDPEILSVFKYRIKTSFAISTCARPWLETASADPQGRIFFAWNSHGRQDGHKAPRTGRISSSPNGQNIPKSPDLIAFSESEEGELKPLADKLDVKILRLPGALQTQVGALPSLRSYIVGRKRGRKRDYLVNHDYSQQELRILAHYEDGPLFRAYRENPSMDVHEFTRGLIRQTTSKDLPRRKVKNVGFSIVNGAGVKGYLHYIGGDEDDPQQLAESKLLRDSYLEGMPGVSELMDALQERGKTHWRTEKGKTDFSREGAPPEWIRVEGAEPVRTYGGRAYYSEKPFYKGRRLFRWEYKLMSMLIQGSAGDCLKEGMVNYFEHPEREGYLLLNVHDELLGGCSPNERALKHECRVLHGCMEDVHFDLPILVDPKVSRGSWADGVKP